MKKILIINAGSSSIKFQLFDKGSLEVVAKGKCDAISIGGIFDIEYQGKKQKYKHDFYNHDYAIDYLINFLLNKKILKNKNDIIAIGHRIVHGGNKITKSTIVNNKIKSILNEYKHLAPLHLPIQLSVINKMESIFINVNQIIVMDTAFHKTIEPINYMYGIKLDWLNNLQIRKYGFHGISYNYVLNQMLSITKKKELNLIICHLGNGASICAIKKNKSVNTSMGFSPNEGLIMGTRSGDINIDAIEHASKKLNLSINEIISILNKESGLKGLCNLSDIRDLEENINNQDVKMAIQLFIKKIVDYIAIYLNDLDNKIDALVFCGGIGENSSLIRNEVIKKLKLLKLEVDPKKNTNIIGDYSIISTHKSEVPIYVVKTNEELMIANEIIKLIN